LHRQLKDNTTIACIYRLQFFAMSVSITGLEIRLDMVSHLATNTSSLVTRSLRRIDVDVERM